MKSASRCIQFVALAAVVAGLAVSASILPGCAPAPQEPLPSPPIEPAAPVPAEPEEPAAPPSVEPAARAAEEPTGPVLLEPAAPAPMEPATPASEEPVSPAPDEPVDAETVETAGAPEVDSAEEAEPAEPADKAAGTESVVAVDPAKVSTFAPAEDLVNQVEEYLDELEEPVESEDDFEDMQSKLAKDANSFILIALALGLHDTDNQYKEAAPAMIKAAQELAKAEDFATATARLEALKTATSTKGGIPAELKWEKVASLKELMEAVPLLDSRVGSRMRRFDSRGEELAGYSAVLAVIAHGSMANADETVKPDEVEKWHAFCAQMRDAAAALNAAVHAKDEPAAQAAEEKLEQSCSDCHDVFKPDH